MCGFGLSRALGCMIADVKGVFGECNMGFCENRLKKDESRTGGDREEWRSWEKRGILAEYAIRKGWSVMFSI